MRIIQIGKSICLILCVMFSTLHGQPIIKTGDGKVVGYTENEIHIFKGIPFAAPPVGNLRWKNPQPVQKWKGVKDCSRFSASPIQDEPRPVLCWSEEFIAKPEPLNEDCLYLNVWTPTKAKEKLPVMVWIYGGGLSSGSANCDIYDGAEMAKQGIVFVSLNYRVGIMGFMAHPELTKESDTKTSGNYGFHDQIAALKWVKKNIAKFNGDPNNVTIAGQSAGAFSVNVLIATAEAKGLFHKAIPQSGGILSTRMMQDIVTSEQHGLEVMSNAKAKNIEELRKMSAKDIQQLSRGNGIGRFGITLDNKFLPSDLTGHFKMGKHNMVPIMTGWVTGDGSLFGESKITLAEYKKEVTDKYKANAEEYLNLFPATNDAEARNMKALEALIGFAAMPSHKLVGSTSAMPSYVYEFSHVPPDKPNFPNYGAFHTSEVPYALHTLHLWNRSWQALDHNLEKTMSAYWVNFVKTGNPNGQGLPQWKAYSVDKGHIMQLGDKVNCTEGLFKKRFDFLEKY